VRRRRLREIRHRQAKHPPTYHTIVFEAAVWAEVYLYDTKLLGMEEISRYNLIVIPASWVCNVDEIDSCC
jgi:hypothetical protein